MNTRHTHNIFNENGWRYRVVADGCTVVEISDTFELQADADAVGKAAAEMHNYVAWKRTAVDPMNEYDGIDTEARP